MTNLNVTTLVRANRVAPFSQTWRNSTVNLNYIQTSSATAQEMVALQKYHNPSNFLATLSINAKIFFFKNLVKVYSLFSETIRGITKASY